MVSAWLTEEYLTDELESTRSVDATRLVRDQSSKARFNTRSRYRRGKNAGAISGAHRRRGRRSVG